MSTIDTLTLPGTEKDIAVKLLTESIPEESGQVIIHATVTCQASWEMVRIWKTTFLIDRHSNHESRLILADNITHHRITGGSKGPGEHAKKSKDISHRVGDG